MSKLSVIYDARRRSERVQRKKYHCTSCGAELPKSRRKWGLVWDSNIHGICVTCLTEIREAIKHKYRFKEED